MTLRSTCLMTGTLMLTLAMGQATADLVWFTDTVPGNEITDESGTPLDASANDPLTGDFLQLIYSPSGTISPAARHDISPTGVTGDNVVIDTSFFGFGTDGFLTPTIDGAMQVIRGAGSFAENDFFFVRAWTEPASNFATGEIATSLDLKYGNSAPYTYLAEVAGDNFAFDTQGALEGWAANLAVIPEPSTLAILLLGFGLLGRRIARTRR